MKKWKRFLIVGVMFLGCAGCGAQKPKESYAVDIKPVDVVRPESGLEEAEPDSVPTESEAEKKNNSYDDLKEKGDGGETTAFAQKIQTAAAAKDMEALADLCSYPLAVNGEIVENKDAFMGLGEDVIFTEERCAVIEAVDVSSLEETMAGVIMGDAVPNIIFKAVDGELRITGIN